MAKTSKKAASEAARALSKLGAAKGGVARARMQSKDARSAIARSAAMSRWGTPHGPIEVRVRMDGRRSIRTGNDRWPWLMMVKTEATRPGRRPWCGEVILALDAPGSTEPHGLAISPAGEEWIDANALLKLGRQFTRDVQRGDAGECLYRVNEEGGVWTQLDD